MPCYSYRRKLLAFRVQVSTVPKIALTDDKAGESSHVLSLYHVVKVVKVGNLFPLGSSGFAVSFKLTVKL